MRRIIYDVAVSCDGFIAGAGDDHSGFIPEGDHVDAYLTRLQSYSTVIMGRRTYQAGYQYGMKPGDLPYPHMDHHVFSRSLDLPAGTAVNLIRGEWEERLDVLRSGDGGEIYLCGGGAFAGYLARRGLVDVLRLKVSPVVLGGGVPLFTGLDRPIRMSPVHIRRHSSGVLYTEYAVEGVG